MKRSLLTWTAGGLALLALVVTCSLLIRNHGSAALSANAPRRSRAPADAEVPAVAQVRNDPVAVSTVSAPRPKPTIRSNGGSGSGPTNLVHLRPGDVLARVNNKPVQLGDLVPMTSKDAEQTMTAEEFESRLNRAIDMELVFQAATAGQVGLRADQEQRLVRLAEKRAKEIRDFEQQGFTWNSTTDAQIQFEKRLMTALLLQQNLVAKEGTEAPSSDAVRQASFESALRTMFSRLRASATILHSSKSAL